MTTTSRRVPTARALTADQKRASRNGADPLFKPFQVISDQQAESLPPPEWCIEPVMPAAELSVLFGPRGVSKTFLALSWSFAIARGVPWLGHEVDQGTVVYIMAEGRGGIGNRVRAVKQAMGITGFAGVYFIPQAVPTLDDAEVDRLIATITGVGECPSLIVWDTLSRTFIGGEENSAKDMALYVANVDRVGEELGGPTRLIVHHSGHGSDDRERGSSVLGGAAAAMMALREKDGLLELTCEKMKDAAHFEPILLQRVEVGPSCVISLPNNRGSNDSLLLSGIERKALTLLSSSFLDDGASATAWLKASELVDSSFYRARTQLVRKGLVTIVGYGKLSRYVLSTSGREALNSHTPMLLP